MTDPRTTLVLLVEDNPADADLVQDRLESNGCRSFRLLRSTRISDAVRALRENPVDAALLDMSIPDSGGLESIRSLRATRADVPIVILTGNENEAFALECLNAGAQDYLLKSEITAPALRRAIRYAITRQRELLERIRLERQLEDALARALGGFLPICSHCKRIREDEVWRELEDYVSQHSSATFSHGICPNCLREHYPEYKGNVG